MFVTLAIIAVTCVVSFSAFNNPKLVEELILWPPAVKTRKQYYRLITHGLIHADGQHLLFNMLTLYFFGRAIEGFFASYIGEVGFLAFYIGGIVVAILPTYLKNQDNPSYRSLGASGAVSAVLFAFILLQPWTTILVFFIPLPAILYAVAFVGYSIYMDKRGGGNINHSAHLWGAVYGVIVTLAMDPRVFDAFLQQLGNPHFM